MIKKIILISFLVSLFLTIGYFASAAKIELNYPTLPGGISINPNSTKPLLPQYIKYAFSLALWISGLIVFISLVWSGVKYVLSAGNPGAASDAREGITAAVLGLVVLLSSYILLITINPQLVLIQPTISANWGITVYAAADCNNGAGIEGQDFFYITKTSEFNVETSEGVRFAISSIKFNAPPGSLSLKLIRTWTVYDATGGATEHTSEEQINNDNLDPNNQCVNIFPLPPVSFIEFYWRLPGVNLVNINGIEKNVPDSVALLDSEFNDKVTDIILRSLSQPTKYGAVLHAAQNFSQECQVYIEENSVGFSINWPDHNLPSLYEIEANTATSISQYPHPGGFGVSSVTVFSPDNRTEYDDQGVTFYREPNYQTPMEINGVTRHHGGIVRFVGDPNTNDATSIRIDGKYIAILFDERDFQSGCQVFDKSDPNLRDDQIGKCFCVTGWWCHDCMESFMIIPTK